MPPDSGLSRRHILQILTGIAALAAGVRPSLAGEARIAKLIGAARDLPAISQRIDFISRALLGSKYRGYTLIGGPRRPEKFVVRDDGFDCVTFCETVLAAAIARDLDEFENALRMIRYHNGVGPGASEIIISSSGASIISTTRPAARSPWMVRSSCKKRSIGIANSAAADFR